MKYFDLEKINFNLLMEMYKPTHPGYVLIPAAFTEAGQKAIIKEISTKMMGNLRAAPEYEGTVWQNFTGLQIVEPLQQLHESRFAAAAVADQSDFFTGGDFFLFRPRRIRRALKREKSRRR